MSYYWPNGYGSPFGMLGNQSAPWAYGGGNYGYQTLPSASNDNYNIGELEREWMEMRMNNYSTPYAQQPNRNGGGQFGVWDPSSGAQFGLAASEYGVQDPRMQRLNSEWDRLVNTPNRYERDRLRRCNGGNYDWDRM